MAIKEIHNFGCSVKTKLLNISRNEKLGYQMLVTRYLQERLLYRLSISPYYDHFFLKGGALLYAHERFMARPTLDIDFNILAYSLETVIAEKFQTVIVRAEANSRMKDFYDLYTILHGGKYDSEILSEAINATFENRQTAYTDNHIVFSHDFANNTDLNTRWNSFVKKLELQQELTFPEVVGFLQTKLEPYWEKLK